MLHCGRSAGPPPTLPAASRGGNAGSATLARETPERVSSLECTPMLLPEAHPWARSAYLESHEVPRVLSPQGSHLPGITERSRPPAPNTPDPAIVFAHARRKKSPLDPTTEWALIQQMGEPTITCWNKSLRLITAARFRGPLTMDNRSHAGTIPYRANNCIVARSPVNSLFTLDYGAGAGWPHRPATWSG